MEPDDYEHLPKAKELGELPAILNIPPKLFPAIRYLNHFRYFLFDGGRVSGKTQTVARIISYLCESQKLRVCCGREIQNNIHESVYTVFTDLIESLKLAIEVSAQEIEHKTTKANIIFKGFREQGKMNVKGLEGVDVLWIDEAQTITKPTLDVIIPTVRKNNAKVFFTMNRHVETDPVFVEMANRSDCLHIHIDYVDNPFCPPAMIDEAEKCRGKSMDDYLHIWLGEPLHRADNYLFGIDLLRQSMALDMARIGVRRTILGNDVARFGNCENVFSVIQSRGPVQWEQIHLEAHKKMPGDQTIGKHFAMHKDFWTDAHAIDADGMGGPIVDLIGHTEFEVYAFYAVKDYENKDKAFHCRRTEAYFKLLDWLEKDYLKILNDPVLIQQLLTIKYKFDGQGRKWVVPKDEMKDDSGNVVPSPDRADALMMQVWFADNLMGPEFAERHPTYAPVHTNLNLETQNEGFVFDSKNPE